MDSSQLFHKLHNSYLDDENSGRESNSSREMMFTFCNVLHEGLHEPQIALTREQIEKMFSILTQEQLSCLSKKFEKDKQFWY